MMNLQKLLLFIAIFHGGIRSSENVPGDISTKSHPMLYFSHDYVATMREKATTTHKQLAQLILETRNALVTHTEESLPSKNHTIFASEWNERYGNRLCAYAMHCLLEPNDTKAFKLVREFMDRMESYPDWYLTESRGKHQSPVAHSLIGFLTAYDFLYNRFDKERRQIYYVKIKETTAHMYEVLMQRKYGWTKQYIHNLMFANTLALFLGALVVKTREPHLAEPWLDESTKLFDFSMNILSQITDGSLDEGMCYTTYASRGITQYVYLAKRHLDIDHTKNPWLTEHFWFIYKTTLPGFQHPFGFADGRKNWCYGPQSQLVFLDTYVMKNGYGNWLADKIRNSTSNNTLFEPHADFLWSTLHTEFIFYNATLKPRIPPMQFKNNLYIFPDLGLVTYGGGQEISNENTFLSFKSGVLNGEHVEYIRYNNSYPDKIKGWKGLNPGHEHPDQNSFVFSPNGSPFVTEAYYGPKFSFLDNVIVFGPFNASVYNQTWEGQIGERDTWLRYVNYNERKMRGEILTASTSDEMVFIAGESGGTYSASLGLSSVFRGVLLLNPEVLVVIDSIKLQLESNTKYASAMFHNTWKHFEKFSYMGYKGAKLSYPEGSYKMFSMKKEGNDICVNLHKDVEPGGLGLREGLTNFVNVTFSLENDVTDVIHVFAGPKYGIRNAKFLPTDQKSRIALALSINNVEHKIQLSTVEPLSKVNPNREAQFNGYATVTVRNKIHYFGLDNDLFNNGKGPKPRKYILNQFLTKKEVSALPELAIFTTSFDVMQNSSDITKERNHNVYTSSDTDRTTDNVSSYVNRNWFSQTPKFILFLPLITFVFTLIILCIVRSTGGKPKWKQIRQGGTLLLVLSFVTVMMIVTYSFRIHVEVGSRWLYYSNVSFVEERNSSNIKRMDKLNEEQKILTFPTKPFVFVTSLPGSGSKLLNEAFYNMSYLSVIEAEKDEYSSKEHLCIWSKDKKEIDCKFIDQIRMHRLQNFTNSTFMNDDSGFWTTKLSFLRNFIGGHDFQPILIVRDPRSWISSILHSKNIKWKENTLKNLLKSVEATCNAAKSSKPLYYEYLNHLYKNSPSSTVAKLSILWTMSISNALANEANGKNDHWPLQIVRFEDIIKYPDKSVTDMFSKLGLPLGVKYLSRISRAIKGQRFKFPSGEKVSKNLLAIWKSKLSAADQQIIIDISCPLMNLLDYKCK